MSRRANARNFGHAVALHAEMDRVFEREMTGVWWSWCDSKVLHWRCYRRPRGKEGWWRLKTLVRRFGVAIPWPTRFCTQMCEGNKEESRLSGSGSAFRVTLSFICHVAIVHSSINNLSRELLHFELSANLYHTRKSLLRGGSTGVRIKGMGTPTAHTVLGTGTRTSTF